MTTSDRKALGKKPMLPPDYIDPEITGDDRQMLETFYVACRSEGGTADEFHLRGLRAVLARWGCPPAPPAEGELGVLIRELQDAAFDRNGSDPERAMLYRAADLLAQRHPAPAPAGKVGELVGCLHHLARADWLSDETADILTRAADLLERQAVTEESSATAPVPVAVSERLHQMEDLAADAVAGLRYIEESHGRLYGVGWDRVYKKADRLNPAHALPVPEVTP